MLGTFSGVYASEQLNNLPGENPPSETHSFVRNPDSPGCSVCRKCQACGKGLLQGKHDYRLVPSWEDDNSEAILFVDEEGKAVSVGKKDMPNLPSTDEFTLFNAPYSDEDGSGGCKYNPSSDLLHHGPLIVVDEQYLPKNTGEDIVDCQVHVFDGEDSPFLVEPPSASKVLVWDNENGVTLLDEATASDKKTLSLDDAGRLFSDPTYAKSVLPEGLKVETIPDGIIRAPEGECALSLKGRILQAGNQCFQRVREGCFRHVHPRLNCIVPHKATFHTVVQGEYVRIGSEDSDLAIVIRALDPKQPMFIDGFVDLAKQECDLKVYRAKKVSFSRCPRTMRCHALNSAHPKETETQSLKDNNA